MKIYILKMKMVFLLMKKKEPDKIFIKTGVFFLVDNLSCLKNNFFGESLLYVPSTAVSVQILVLNEIRSIINQLNHFQ